VKLDDGAKRQRMQIDGATNAFGPGWSQMLAGMEFPNAGCWQVTAKYSYVGITQELTFVLDVIAEVITVAVEPHPLDLRCARRQPYVPALVRLIAVETAAGNPGAFRIEYAFFRDIDADERWSTIRALKVTVIPWPANQNPRHRESTSRRDPMVWPSRAIQGSMNVTVNSMPPSVFFTGVSMMKHLH